MSCKQNKNDVLNIWIQLCLIYEGNSQINSIKKIKVNSSFFKIYNSSYLWIVFLQKSYQFFNKAYKTDYSMNILHLSQSN